MKNFVYGLLLASCCCGIESRAMATDGAPEITIPAPAAVRAVVTAPISLTIEQMRESVDTNCITINGQRYRIQAAIEPRSQAEDDDDCAKIREALTRVLTSPMPMFSSFTISPRTDAEVVDGKVQQKVLLSYSSTAGAGLFSLGLIED